MYIPPEHSPVHEIYNVDFFQKIESDISHFSQYGEIFLIGDMNSRTGKKHDYVDHDSFLANFDIDDITVDTPLRRLSMDSKANRFGDCLLDLCKSTEMRIVNGRVFPNTDKMTCFSPNGESVVDYLITSETSFSSLSSMAIHEYNAFSNHAPISFSLIIGTDRSREATIKYNCTLKWNELYKTAFINDLTKDAHLLQDIVHEDVSIDLMVDKFSTFITDRSNVYLKKISQIRSETVFTCADKKEKKLWYNKHCLSKKQKVQESIRDYNLNKTAENRRKVFEARKDYKYFCRKSKQNFNRDRCNQMNNMRKKKPKDFWKLFKRNKKSNQTNLSENDFYEYFKHLSSEIGENVPEEVNEHMQHFDNTETEPTFSELDEPISLAEILNAIKTLKNNKSCGIDEIINEYFCHASEILIGPLHILFNKILDTRSFPNQWATGLIVPIHKKGDVDDTNNYRGITLVSCFAKLFSSVLNNRLKSWSKATDSSTDAQFGFKANHCTLDAVFILKYIIDRQLKDKKKLYCAFIDLRKAFDSVSRASLWYKMIKAGIDGKIFDVIRSMYNSIKLRVKCFNSLSDLSRVMLAYYRGR